MKGANVDMEGSKNLRIGFEEGAEQLHILASFFETMRTNVLFRANLWLLVRDSCPPTAINLHVPARFDRLLRRTLGILGDK